MKIITSKLDKILSNLKNLIKKKLKISKHVINHNWNFVLFLLLANDCVNHNNDSFASSIANIKNKKSFFSLTRSNQTNNCNEKVNFVKPNLHKVKSKKIWSIY